MLLDKLDEWMLFRHDAKRDLEAANVLYRNKNYSNAAFHGQQAFEKMIKAAVLKDGTLNLTARKMAHVPFTRIYEKRLPARCGKEWWKQVDDLDGDAWRILLLNTIKAGSFLHTLFWKMSLNIPMPGLVDDEHLDIPPEYREERMIELEPDSRQPKFKLIPPTSSKSTTVPFMFSNLYLDTYQFNRRKAKSTRHTGDLLAAVLSLVALYLIVYPHESLGRYSIKVDNVISGYSGVPDKNSFEWYEIQKLELGKLLDEITLAVTALDESIASA